jgi:OOP family OmpA-OmpF porin
MSVAGQEISVIGTALTPTEDAAARAALADLPEGYATTFDITVLDDGTPLRLTLGKGEDGAVTSAGKIPSTLEMAELTDALGAEVGEGIAQSVVPPPWASLYPARCR